MKRNQDAGFTLIETLITLLVISLLLLMPTLSFEKITKSMQTDLFFRELSSNITLMQNHAILTGHKTVVEFVPQENLIRFKEDKSSLGSTHPIYREMYLQEEVYEFYGNDYGQVAFNGWTGNITSKNGWTTYIQTSEGLYKIVFWLGSGRFEIQKISSTRSGLSAGRELVYANHFAGCDNCSMSPSNTLAFNLSRSANIS